MASATVAFNAIVVEALNQHNYKDWSSRVQTYLLAEDLWDVVKSAAPRPESKKKSKAWRTKDAKALHAIKISCGTEIFCVIRETKTAKKAWEVLENTFKSRATLYFEKKERDRSLHTANNAGPQTHEVEEELVIADEELASEGERDRSLHTANNAGQKREVGKEVALANEELEIKAGEGGNENVEEFHPMYGPFFGYVVKGNWDNAKDCLATLHPNAIRAKSPEMGFTALHFAASNGHAHIVKELVSLMRVEDLEIKDNDGYTALHKAVYKRNVDIVKHLVPLMKPEALSIKGKYGETVLHVVAKFKYDINIVKELVSLMRKEDLEIQDNNGCTALHNAVYNRNVDIVKHLVPLMRPEALRIKGKHGETALHVVAKFEHDINTVKELVSRMREEDLEIKDNDGCTALHNAVYNRNVDIVKQLVPLMRPEALRIKGKDGATALHVAASFGQLKIVKELVSLMREEDLEIQDNNGCTALHNAVFRTNVDIVKQLTALMRPEGLGLKNNNDETALHRAVSFQHDVNIVKELVSLMRKEDLEIKDDVGNTALGLATSANLSEGHLVQIARCMVEKNKQIRGITLANKVIPVVNACGWGKWEMCRYLYSVTPLEALLLEDGTQGALLISTCIRQRKGDDIAWDLLQRCPRLAIVDKGVGEPPMLTLARMRYAFLSGMQLTFLQKWIYNSIHVQPVDFNAAEISINVSKSKDDQGNQRYPICSANLSPLTRIQGASLQMQRELQWFKEVESIVPVEKHEYLNFSDGLTARELFTKNHKKLKEEAEISMKGTATSCTTVGALIVTIMFAVAFTVPGGTNDDTGFPIFMHKKLFKVFIIADIISLASSSTSVITFLGILTSRYAEYDFLKSLPKKMMVGLSALFISIATMMVTFFCALTIMLDGEAWIIIPSIMFASVPVISFIWFLFPLLVEICKSTYGPGIFVRNLKRWY